MDISENTCVRCCRRCRRRHCSRGGTRHGFFALQVVVTDQGYIGGVAVGTVFVWMPRGFLCPAFTSADTVSALVSSSHLLIAV